jgi:hypothetical protein
MNTHGAFGETLLPTSRLLDSGKRDCILQNKIPTATEEANQGSDPEKKQAEHGTELYQINDWKYCCKLLILRSARV